MTDLLENIGRSVAAAEESGALLAAGRLNYLALVWLRRQRVQIRTRTESSPTWTICLWRLGRKVRFVRGAFRTQRPECWWRMLRPKVVPFPQTAQIAGMVS